MPFVSTPKLDALRSPVSETGYHFVYFRRARLRKPYRAWINSSIRSERDVHLGYYGTAIEAAEAVVKYFDGIYGDEWGREELRLRKANHCQVVLDPGGEPGYVVITYVTGRRKVIQPKGRRETFRTRMQARKGFKEWLRGIMPEKTRT